MAIVEVKVPQLSESVAEATLLQWKKKPGEAVAMDEILIEIETDKVVLEVPAPAAGVMGNTPSAEKRAWVAASATAPTSPHKPQCTKLTGKPCARAAWPNDASAALPAT